MRKTNSVTRHFATALCILIALAAVATPALAQYTSGIVGTVTDQTGAVIPSAQLSITDEETQVSQKARANAQGFVQVLHLPPGHYTAVVTAPGFQSWQETGINIDGSDIRSIYPKLSVGTAHSTVKVSANTGTIQTTSATVSRTLEQETVKHAPLIGQDIDASLTTMAPGITGSGFSAGGASSSGSQGTNSFNAEPGYQVNAAGQRQESNMYEVDGTDVNGNSRGGITNVTPEPDTVSQVKISTSVFSATASQSGALIQIFTKSGTNKFHGDFSEFNTGSSLTSRTEFQTKVPSYVRNDFGGTIGGPILKDNTFFFGSIFWSRSNQAVTLTQTVETPAFVNYVETNYPNTLATQFFKQAPIAAKPTSGFQTVSQIEQSLVSPYTPPNIPGNLIALGNASISQSPINNGFQGHLRIDHTMHGGNDKIFYSIFRSTTHGGVADARPNLAYVSPNATLYNKIDYVHVFSPSLVNDASVTYVRASGDQPIAPGTLPTLPNAYPGGLSTGFGQWGPSGWVHNNWNWHDVLTYVRGRHTLRMGADVVRQQDLDDFTAGLDRPTFYFANIVDFAVDHPDYQSGPIVDVKNGGTAQSLYSRVLMLQTSPYVQDDWKVSPKLTLNIGLRWDYFGHLSTATYGPTPIPIFTPGPGNTEEQRIANGSMQVRGSNGQVTSKAMWRFDPRFGFAYDVFGNGTTSIRGGWGMFSNKIGDLSYMDNLRTNSPQYANPSISAFISGTTLADFSYGTSSSGATGFATPPGIQYQVDSRGGLVGTRTSVGGVQPNLVPPMVQNWALSVQHLIGKSLVLEADYFGSAGRDLYFQTDSNRYAGDLTQHNGTLDRLNPSFGSILYGQSIGIDNSDVASFSVTKRFTRGWSLHAIYTYGKSLDYTSSNDNGVGGAENVIDVNNPSRNYGRSDYDVRNRFSFDSVWNIPGLRRGFGGQLTSGWTLTPVLILQSGSPFTVYTSASYPSGDFNADGYNYDVPNVPSFGSTISASRSQFLKGVFTVSDFPRPAAGKEGDLGRNTYNGPGLINTNLAAQRSFKLHFLGDEGRFMVRGEFLNLFNRVNLTNPVGDMANGEFGKSTDQYLPRTIEFLGRVSF